MVTSTNISKKHIEKKGVSFDFPDYYLVANIPSNTPDCVIALAKNDGGCDIMVEVSNELKISYVQGTFEKNYEEYIKKLGFYDMEVIHGFGKLRTCVQAYYNHEKGVMKSIIYFDFRYKKDLRITLNTLDLDYNPMTDLKIISDSIVYNKKKLFGLF